MIIDARQRLIVALDVPNRSADPNALIERDDALRLMETLGDTVSFYKVGWPLYMAGGQELIRELIGMGKRVFLDLKFGDIAETIRRLILVATKDGVDFLTVNTSIQAVRAAVEAKGASNLKILTVTLLTSLNEQDLIELGIKTSVEEYVLHKTEKALDVNCDGVIASGKEVSRIREQFKDREFTIVTPGIRPEGVDHHDHKRAVTPSSAIKSGSDYLVVGRPITQSASPLDMVNKIVESMQGAFDQPL